MVPHGVLAQLGADFPAPLGELPIFTCSVVSVEVSFEMEICVQTNCTSQAGSSSRADKEELPAFFRSEIMESTK
jgi:hypothetical protein